MGLAQTDVDVHEFSSRVTHFPFLPMVEQEEDAANEHAMTSDRFTATVYECWVSQDDNCKGKYICGPYDTTPMDELEQKNKKRPV
ncbi:hypothetical protein HPB48_004662 [Haemaphysalis longicornis]|uniref:Uncharacterized protein n=1 Tax=Haemaphysalis longicornis TaxID=44386 RepID=A0A9J6G0V7_HAELO|nr:hypothetical protein HPB48_004662 [Haemaphysalis longicornis]